jgi:hypothetical protein
VQYNYVTVLVNDFVKHPKHVKRYIINSVYAGRKRVKILHFFHNNYSFPTNTKATMHARVARMHNLNTASAVDNNTSDHRINATTAEVKASVTASSSDKKEVVSKCSLCRFWHLWGLLRQAITETPTLK